MVRIHPPELLRRQRNFIIVLAFLLTWSTRINRNGLLACLEKAQVGQ